MVDGGLMSMVGIWIAEATLQERASCHGETAGFVLRQGGQRERTPCGQQAEGLPAGRLRLLREQRGGEDRVCRSSCNDLHGRLADWDPSYASNW